MCHQAPTSDLRAGVGFMLASFQHKPKRFQRFEKHPTLGDRVNGAPTNSSFTAGGAGVITEVVHKPHSRTTLDDWAITQTPRRAHVRCVVLAFKPAFYTQRQHLKPLKILPAVQPTWATILKLPTHTQSIPSATNVSSSHSHLCSAKFRMYFDVNNTFPMAAL